MVAKTRSSHSVGGAVPRMHADVGHDAQLILRIGFVLAPIIAGLDKFFYFLGDWSRYLSPEFASISPLSVGGTMLAVGVVEMGAGLVVAFKPRIGGWLVAGWLAAIIVNLVLLGAYWDVALRDFGLMLGAIALALLSARSRAW